MAGIPVDSIPYVTRKDQQLLLWRLESISLEATPVYHGVSIAVYFSLSLWLFDKNWEVCRIVTRDDETIWSVCDH